MPNDLEVPTFRSPVVNAHAADVTSGAKVAVDDVSDLTKFVIRCGSNSDTARQLGVTFGKSRSVGDVVVSALRPDEIWLFGPAADVVSLIASLPDDLARPEIDLTHGRVLLRVSGSEASRLLEKVCGLDWSDAMMPDGAAASASLAKVTCDIVRNDLAGDDVSDEERIRSYLIACDRSYGQYLYDAVVDAGREFVR